MRVLVIGKGGREHALVWKIFQSERVDKIYAAPGNDGMAHLAERVAINYRDIERLADWAEENRIDLTLVGPEEPLVAGIVDLFNERGLKIFGPNKKAARIEGSKVFAKSILKKYRIPTAEYEVFMDPEEALEYLDEAHYPLVIKAEGLARGKGVVIATRKKEAFAAVDKIMDDRIFGSAGQRIVIEDFLAGREVSIIALTDGKHIIPLPPAQDHKPVFDGDEGPNTGGMGSYSPVSFISGDMEKRICEEIMKPAIRAFQEEGIDYKGIIYTGLIVTDMGPKVLDFNPRFGDPETQVILPRLQNDLIEVIEKVMEGRMEDLVLEWDKRTAVCVILASGGYPIAFDTGMEINGLEELKKHDNVLVFHAGTRRDGDKYLTDNGRVLGITVLGDGLFDSLNQVYQCVDMVNFNDMHYRSDIGFQAVEE